MLKVKSGLFLLSLRYIALLDEKLNLQELNWNIKCEIFRVSSRQGEIQYRQKPNKMLMPVSEVCVLAVYDLPSMISLLLHAL